MGFFSWKTSDTGRSIANEYQDAREVFTVFMHDDKGKVWIEESYGGYGVFGGKDYYELLAEMNGFTTDDVEALDREGINVYNDFRGIGISLQFHPEKFKGLIEGELVYPQLLEEERDPWGLDFSVAPKNCPYQGFFYDTDDDGNELF